MNHSQFIIPTRVDTNLPVILVDLDGTLYNNHHRAHLMPPANERHLESAWRPFNRAAEHDLLIPSIAWLIKRLMQGAAVNIIYCTSRGVAARDVTVHQLNRDELLFPERCALAMRATGNNSSAGEFKSQVVDELRQLGFNGEMFIIDDSQDVIDTLAEINVTALQVKTQCAAESEARIAAGWLLKEEKAAHRQTKESLGRALARNSAQAVEINQLKQTISQLESNKNV